MPPIIIFLIAVPVALHGTEIFHEMRRARRSRPTHKLRLAFLRGGKLIHGGKTHMIAGTSERFQLIIIGKSGKLLVPQPTLSKVQIGGDTTLGNIVASATDPSIFDVVSTAGPGSDAISVSLVATENGIDWTLTASLGVDIEADAPASIQLKDLGATPAAS